MLPDTLTFIDVETTGGSFSYDRVIEIGILKVRNGEVVDTFESFINPHKHIPPEITQITGITPDDVADAPSFRSVRDQVEDLLTESTFVAHNARFDYGFIKHEFSLLGSSFTAKQLCTARLSRMLYPQHRRHNLDSIIERFGFTCERRHRALDDAKVLWDFYQTIQTQFTPEQIDAVVMKVMRQPARPLQIAESVIANLPESAGVYIFYGLNDMPIYVGKSKHIKERVMSHFSDNISSSKEWRLSQEVTHIETISTAGELGALLKESELVKTLQPLHNRLLREVRELVLAVADTREGYPTVKLSTDIPENFSDILAVFRTRKHATEKLRELAQEYRLCSKLLGLEKTSGKCFSHSLGWCPGACVGKEDVLSYQLRFTEAFHDTRIKQWPFAAPIVIEETDVLKGRREGFIFDQWQHIGTLIADDFGQIGFTPAERASFDYDVYKIVSGFLLNRASARTVRVLKAGELEHYRGNVF